ncbi:MAG TPA: NAD(P)/FAD-dependent oxidoreductase [Myxococcota bacterium]|nr:NAD(P)/FAD-dependent oxidoreductase [Myxococcota bacterium]
MTRCEPTQTPDDIDIPALREKYRQERDKRLRKEGSRQFLHTEDELADFFETDPHSPPVVRDPISQDADVVILGGGFAGLIAGARLKQAGVEDVRIVEMGGDFGGVWYWNRYPGIQCDNESYTYIPLLEELGTMPSKKFADGAEIHAHCQRIGKHFGLYEGALFGTRVQSLRWDESIARWRVATHRGDDIRARFLVMALGLWSKPKLPGIPGIRDFEGRMFHSSRWDYAYTGGSPEDPRLDKLANQHVALIGTGASGIQLVPYLGRYAGHLYVFQRTPSSVDVRGNKPTDPEWVKGLEPGWQKERQANFHAWSPLGFAGLVPGRADLVCDFWTEMIRNVAAKVERMGNPQLTPEQLGAMLEEEDYRVMERLRRRVDGIVKDPKTAETLKPYYRFMCKRPCSNDDYLPTFNRPNVTLVDVSASRGVERMTAKGLVAEGVEYPVDCVVFASGFEISPRDQRAGWGIEVIEGRNRVSLYDHWAHGYKTFHGMTSHGFPNQFFTGFTQGAVSANTTSMYEQQAEHIAYIVGEARRRGVRIVEPTQEAEDRWVQTIRDTAIPSDFLEQCTPGYYNNEGGGDGGIRSALGEPYGPGFYAFDKLLQEWRDDGRLEGLVLRR